MDETEIWNHYGPILERIDVSDCEKCCELWTNANCSLITLFLYMVAELSAIQQIIELLTGMNGLPAVIVECVVTTVYTCT